jgi:signal transduction histidine kinase
MQSSKPALERTIAAAIILTALATALIAIAGARWPPLPGHARSQPGSATADALAAAIGRGSAPAPLLDTFAAAGAIRAATVYDRGGSVIASNGAPSRNVELICRSLPNGASLCIEPVETSTSLVTALPTLVAALIAGVIIASIVTSIARGRLRAMRAAFEVEMREELQSRDAILRRRTAEVEAANRDLESFASAVSHDLRAPLGSISGFAQALDEDFGVSLEAGARECVFWIRESAKQMSGLIEGLLQMSRFTHVDMTRTDVDLSSIARGIAISLQRNDASRDVAFEIPEGVTANGDERLLRALLENLLGNAWKFTSKKAGARIELGVRYDDGQPSFYVRDNGAGFDPAHAAKMFRPFQRLHSEKEFGGTGIGLATVQKIVQRHGGRAWAEGEPDRGATVYFTTGAPHEINA